MWHRDNPHADGGRVQVFSLRRGASRDRYRRFLPGKKEAQMKGKYCPNCKKTKHTDEFYKNKRSHSADGLSYYCSECDRLKHKESRQNRLEAYRARDRKSYRAKRGKFKQDDLFSAYRPATGPRCHCGKTLYDYEIKLGECLSHVQKRCHAWHNEPVQYTQVAASD
jgi:hypothetical protein